MNRPLLRSRKMILPSRGINVAHVQESVLSIMVDLQERLPGESDSALHVLIKNDGLNTITSLELSLDTPAGVNLVNPGEIFGGGHRSVTLEKLTPKQAVRFKIGIRSHPEFKKGELNFHLREVKSAERILDLPIPLIVGKR